MKQVTIHEAKTHLSRLLREVADGEEIIIAHGDRPVARIVPVDRRAPRRAGGAKEFFTAVSGDFDAPLEDFREYAK